MNLFSHKTEPVRLHKQEASRWDVFCMKIAPYVIVLSLIVFSGLILFAATRYGAGLTATEANTMQRLELII